MYVVGTAGHVDHGKSTLVEALTGIDPDRFEEEKRRGLTIDLGFAWLTLPSGREIGIVDVPGHERFIRNMLAGVGAVDAAMFVVAADEGWMPQSAEHLQILDFLQVGRGVLVVTKSDLVDADLLELAAEEAFERVQGTALHGAPVVAVSAKTGAGLDELRATLDDVLATTAGSPDRGRPRLFVDRSFTIAGAGTVVTGTLTGGRLHTDDEVDVLGTGATARIRSLQTHRRTVDEATPGSRVAINLVGLGRRDVSRGDAIGRAGRWLLTDTFAARLRAARDLDHQLIERGAYELYAGSAEVRCRIKFLSEDAPGIVPVSLHPDRLVPGLRAGADALVQIFIDRALPLEAGDRFIVRDVGRWETVAGGVVLDQAPGRIRRGDASAIERLQAREGLTRPELVARIVAERRLVSIGDLSALSGVSEDEITAGLPPGTARTAGHVVAAPAELEQRVRDLVAVHHDTHPLDAGIPREALRRELGLDARAFAELLEMWVDAGTLVTDAGDVRLPARGAELTPEDRERADAAIEALRAAGVTPPDLGDLGLPIELLKALERHGEVVFVTPSIVFAADVMRWITERVIQLLGTQGSATVSQIRDAISTTRKFAVPVLEYLDAKGVTRRQGDERVLGRAGRER